MTLRVAVLTVSDRVSAHAMEDLGGPAVAEALSAFDVDVVRTAVVPDDRMAIAATLREWTERADIDVVFTTGGTGLGPRDVTPEATLDVADRVIPGIGEAMRDAGLEKTRHAMLSRAIAAIHAGTLIVNLPGSPRGAAEGVQVVGPILQHAVDTLHGGRHAG